MSTLALVGLIAGITVLALTIVIAAAYVTSHVRHSNARDWADAGERLRQPPLFPGGRP